METRGKIDEQGDMQNYCIENMVLPASSKIPGNLLVEFDGSFLKKSKT